ncbi:phage scaffolding protein [Streptomyces antimycoticus]|uniref:phage scaffolding protein n=1 Tax=Streptomyces antimycoticus TaxID=68175 RepID=UPI00369C9053
MSDETTETTETTENEVSEQHDIKAMQAALKKANSEALHYRTVGNTYKDLYIKSQTEKALSEAGLTNSKAARLLDYSQITVMESGDIEGLTEQLEALREDLPELFAPAEKKVTGGADAADKKEARPMKSTAQKLTSRFGKA